MTYKLHLIADASGKDDRGWGNGYLGIPPEHPWYNKNYNEIDNVVIHGGLTWSESHLPNWNKDSDDFWWLGFDTAHGGDNKKCYDQTYVEEQLNELKKQADTEAAGVMI